MLYLDWSSLTFEGEVNIYPIYSQTRLYMQSEIVFYTDEKVDVTVFALFRAFDDAATDYSAPSISTALAPMNHEADEADDDAPLHIHQTAMAAPALILKVNEVYALPEVYAMPTTTN